jgi:hypothetical protein
MPEWLTLTEWAKKVGLSVSRASRLRAQGRISAEKVGSVWLVRADQPRPQPLSAGKKRKDASESKGGDANGVKEAN